MKKGVIVDFSGSWVSGMATLVIKDEEGIHKVPCDNGATVRALASISPDVIGRGHTINVEAIKGKEIYWDWDDLGLVLGYLSPA